MTTAPVATTWFGSPSDAAAWLGRVGYLVGRGGRDEDVPGRGLGKPLLLEALPGKTEPAKAVSRATGAELVPMAECRNLTQLGEPVHARCDPNLSDPPSSFPAMEQNRATVTVLRPLADVPPPVPPTLDEAIRETYWRSVQALRAERQALEDAV